MCILFAQEASDQLTLKRLNVSYSAILYAEDPSPHTIHTSASGRTNFAPSAKPPPTPNVPNAPGSNQRNGPRGLI